MVKTGSATSDESLALEVRDRRDRSALEELVGRYDRRIFGLLLRFLGSPERAEEAPGNLSPPAPGAPELSRRPAVSPLALSNRPEYGTVDWHPRGRAGQPGTTGRPGTAGGRSIHESRRSGAEEGSLRLGGGPPR